MHSITKKRTLFICQAAMIAAMYVALTYLAEFLGLSSGAIQCRFSEALCILPYFTAAAIPGVSIGCLVANILIQPDIFNIIFGTLATLIGAVGTYLLRKTRIKWLAPLPPIVSNALIIPFVLKYAYHLGDGIMFLILTVGAGELLSAGLLGMLLLFAVEPNKKRLGFVS